MRVILCGGAVGPSVAVFDLLYQDGEITDLYVYTHPVMEYQQTEKDKLAAAASAGGVGWSMESINDARLPWKPDCVISIYYRTIIQPHIISACGGKIFNAHTSLLPRHRGRSSIPWAIFEGDIHCGITYHYIDNGVDTGPVIFQASTQILRDDTQATVFKRINKMVVDFFPAAFILVKAGFRGVEQWGIPSLHAGGPPCGGKIDPDWPWGKIMRFIRAMNYPPLPYATYQGYQIKDEGDYRRALFDAHFERQKRKAELKAREVEQ